MSKTINLAIRRIQFRATNDNGGYVDCLIRFQGQYFDNETGLHYNRHRYYDPEGGDYLTPDPIGLAGGLRSFGYVPDPTSLIDPLGLAVCQARYNRYKALRDKGYIAKDASRLSKSSPDGLLQNGQIKHSEVKDWADVNGLKNNWSPDPNNPNRFASGGYNYKNSSGGNDYYIHGHGADVNAPIGSNVFNGPTTRITQLPAGKHPMHRSGRSLLPDGSYGKFKGNENSAHLPLVGSQY